MLALPPDGARRPVEADERAPWAVVAGVRGSVRTWARRHKMHMKAIPQVRPNVTAMIVPRPVIQLSAGVNQPCPNPACCWVRKPLQPAGGADTNASTGSFVARSRPGWNDELPTHRAHV